MVGAQGSTDSPRPNPLKNGHSSKIYTEQQTPVMFTSVANLTSNQQQLRIGSPIETLREKPEEQSNSYANLSNPESLNRHNLKKQDIPSLHRPILTEL